MPCSKRTRVVACLLATALISASALAGCGGGPGETADGGHSNTVGAPPKSFFGVVPQDVLEPGDYKEMAANGVGTIRSGLYWQSVQPDLVPYDFSTFDETVRQAAKNHIRVLPYLYGTPDWVAQNIDGRSCTSCVQYAPESHGALLVWKSFAKAAAERYGPDGSFWKQNPDLPKLPIEAWQVWNEQNSKTFFLPKPDPAGYAKLLAAASDGLHAADPDAEVVLGGMFGTPGGGNPKHSIPAATFLHSLLAIDGAKDDFDGFALHPYSSSVASVREQVEIARREMSDSGDPDVSLWITEVGWSSGHEDNPLNVGSEAAQAQRVAQVYHLFEEHREEWNVRLVAWFAWEDSHASDDFCFFCAKAGLTTDSGEPKPALAAYEKVASGD
jgi:hypothetical protein